MTSIIAIVQITALLTASILVWICLTSTTSTQADELVEPHIKQDLEAY